MCEANQYGEAMKHFELAMLMAPPESLQQLNLQCAWCSWRMGNIEPAKRIYDQVLDADPLCWQVLLPGAEWFSVVMHLLRESIALSR